MISCPRLEIRNIRFRSVVHSDIVSERPATLAIILMSRPIGIDGMLKQAREGTVLTVRVGNEAELRRLE